MMRLIQQQDCRSRAGFTLTELLVVMGVMAVLAGLTAVSYRTIAKDAKLASGKNTVMSVLENARALAMKNNRPTMVMFVPRFTDHSQKDSRVTAYIAEWRGDAIRQIVDAQPNGGVGPRIFERFLLVNGVHPRHLPAGISVAGPNYQTESSIDNQWFAPPNPLKPNEVGRALAVLYLPDGSTSTTLPATATYANNYPFIDFDNDGFQDRTLTANLIDT
jgi:prepilin-type N-terminal cleavage/methylation domain-containing protein